MSDGSEACTGTVARPGLARWAVVVVLIATTCLVGAIYIVGRSLGFFFGSLGEEARYFCKGDVTALRFVGSDSLFVSARVIPDSLLLWETQSGECAALPFAGQSIDVSQDGKWLVTGNYQGEVTLIELPTGRIERQWTLPEGSVLCVAINGDGTMVYFGQGPQLNGPLASTIPEELDEYHFWSLDSRSRGIAGPTASFDEPVRAIDASSDGCIVALRTSTKSLWVWSVNANKFILRPFEDRPLGRPIGSTQLEWGMVGGVTVTPDGRFVQCGYEIVDLKNDSRRNLFVMAHKLDREELGGGSSCHLSQDGRWAAFGYMNGIACVVDTTTASKVWETRVSRSGGNVLAVEFSPNAKYLLTGGRTGRGAFTPLEPKRGITRISDQHVRLWKLDP